jgi:hypothetical protein
MKKYIEVQDYRPAVGMEWTANNYPGPGLYETHSGIALVYGAPPSVSIISVQPMPEIKTQAEGNSIDVHRLFDQLISLKG